MTVTHAHLALPHFVSPEHAHQHITHVFPPILSFPTLSHVHHEHAFWSRFLTQPFRDLQQLTTTLDPAEPIITASCYSLLDRAKRDVISRLLSALEDVERAGIWPAGLGSPAMDRLRDAHEAWNELELQITRLLWKKGRWRDEWYSRWGSVPDCLSKLYDVSVGLEYALSEPAEDRAAPPEAEIRLHMDDVRVSPALDDTTKFDTTRIMPEKAKLPSESTSVSPTPSADTMDHEPADLTELIATPFISCEEVRDGLPSTGQGLTTTSPMADIMDLDSPESFINELSSGPFPPLKELSVNTNIPPKTRSTSISTPEPIQLDDEAPSSDDEARDDKDDGAKISLGDGDMLPLNFIILKQAPEEVMSLGTPPSKNIFDTTICPKKASTPAIGIMRELSEMYGDDSGDEVSLAKGSILRMEDSIHQATPENQSSDLIDSNTTDGELAALGEHKMRTNRLPESEPDSNATPKFTTLVQIVNQCTFISTDSQSSSSDFFTPSQSPVVPHAVPVFDTLPASSIVSPMRRRLVLPLAKTVDEKIKTPSPLQANYVTAPNTPVKTTSKTIFPLARGFHSTGYSLPPFRPESRSSLDQISAAAVVDATADASPSPGVMKETPELPVPNLRYQVPSSPSSFTVGQDQVQPFLPSLATSFTLPVSQSQGVPTESPKPKTLPTLRNLCIDAVKHWSGQTGGWVTDTAEGETRAIAIDHFWDAEEAESSSDREEELERTPKRQRRVLEQCRSSPRTPPTNGHTNSVAGFETPVHQNTARISDFELLSSGAAWHHTIAKKQHGDTSSRGSSNGSSPEEVSLVGWSQSSDGLVIPS